MKIKKNDMVLLLSIINFLIFSLISYFISKLNNGIGTAPLVFSGDDGLMYHQVAVGEEFLDFELFWVKVIKFLYYISVQEPLVIRFFLILIFSFNLLYIAFYNSKNNVYNQFPPKTGIKLIFLMFCFSPSFYLFYFFSIYRDALIAACFFFSSVYFYRRDLIFFTISLVLLFLLRPYMAGALLLSFAIVFFIGVNKPARLLFILLLMFSIAVNVLIPVSNLLGFNLIDFRGGFSDSGANSTFGINFNGSILGNTISYWVSFILNFFAGMPIFYNRPVYVFFFFAQSLPAIIVFILVFSNKIAHSILERKMLITFLVWIMTYSLMNDNAGNSLRLFSAGLPILLFVSARLCLYSGLEPPQKKGVIRKI